MHSGFSPDACHNCLTGCFDKGKPPSGQAKTSWFAAFNDSIYMYGKFSEYILSIIRLYVYTITCQSSISPKSNLQFAAPTLRQFLKNPLSGAAKKPQLKGDLEMAPEGAQPHAYGLSSGLNSERGFKAGQRVESQYKRNLQRIYDHHAQHRPEQESDALLTALRNSGSTT